MEVSPYLAAIQQVAGSTPGEKYRTLNHIAKRIVAGSNDQIKTIEVKPSSELPEPMIPFVKLEIAKITREPHGIAEALKSKDDLIFNQALRVKWFFDGSDETVTNINYFQKNILNSISLKNRKQLIKTLARHLAASNRTDIAEEFYEAVSNISGTSADILLTACSELFIWNTIIRKKLILTCGIFQKLAHKHSNVIIKYLELGHKNEESDSRIMHKINVYDYYEHLPRLLRKHTQFIIGLQITWPNYIKFSKRNTNFIIKNAAQSLIENALKLGPVMDKKLIATKLPKEQFELFFHNLFENYSGYEFNRKFRFMKIYEYLEHYHVENTSAMILSKFEEIYQASFLDQNKLITPTVLRLLPFEMRVATARKMLDRNSKMHFSGLNEEHDWICYLPIEESIPKLKDLISKTTEADDRLELLKKMIYSCRVNVDEDALLQVLEYIMIRHKNERSYIFIQAVTNITSHFSVEKLSLQHWEILKQFLYILYVQDKDSSHCLHYVETVIIGYLHFHLLHDLPLTEPVKFFFDIRNKADRDEWNILIENPQYERKCLEEFINAAPRLYSQNKSKLVSQLFEAIEDFNSRNSKTASKMKRISIEEFPWLMEEVRRLVKSEERYATNVRARLEEHSPVLYHAWVDKHLKSSYISLHSVKIFTRWRKNLQNMREDWERYFNQFMHEYYMKHVQRFVKVCRWHQDIPILYVEKCFQHLTENPCPKNSLYILGCLLDGPAFEVIITPCLSEINYSTLESISRIISFVNPPVSLDVTSHYCKPGIIHTAEAWLGIMDYRIPVDELLPFVINLIDQPVSIAKYFIRILSKISIDFELFHNSIVDLWKKQKNVTIRSLIFQKIFNLFSYNINEETWELLAEYIDDLTIQDRNALVSVCCLDKIPNEIISTYVSKIFCKLNELKNVDDKADRNFIWNEILDLLSLDKKITVLFPKELHQDIFRTYFYDVLSPIHISKAALKYLICAYLPTAADDLESALKFYSNIFSDVLKNYWDVCSSGECDGYKANYIVDVEIVDLCYNELNIETQLRFIDTTLETFLSVLKPIQAPRFYCHCMFVSCYREPQMSLDKYLRKIIEIIPKLITIFSEGFIETLGSIFIRTLSCLMNRLSTLDVIESLLTMKNEYGILLASVIPVGNLNESNYERYKTIFQNIHDQKHPLLMAKYSIEINSFYKEAD